MGNFKGVGVVFVRDKIAGWGEAASVEFAGTLDPPDRAIYERALATSWIPIDAAGRILVAAARYLYPDEADGLRFIGRDMANEHLTTVYRILLRVSSVAFALSQTANYWRAYHDEGKAIAERGAEPRTAHLRIVDYPDLPRPFLEFIDGYCLGMMDLTKVPHGDVARDESDPSNWRFTLTWG